MKKLVTWENLKVERDELESILKLSFLDNFALEMTNLLVLGCSKNRLSFLLSEVVIAFLSLLFLVPIILLVFQKWFLNSNQSSSFLIVILISGIVSLFILLCLNLYLWQKAKKIKNVAILINKIAKYNQLIHNFQLLTTFNDLSTSATSNDFALPSEINSILKATRNSLLNSLELEKLVIQNQTLQLYNRYQLLNSLEDDLVHFLSMENESTENEYQQCLAEVVQIGLSVHQEVRKNHKDCS